MPKVVHIKKATEAFIRIDRTTKWGNPFIIGRDGDRTTVIAKHRDYLYEHPELVAAAKEELRGHDLGCWCAPHACHGDTLLAVANETSHPAFDD